MAVPQSAGQLSEPIRKLRRFSFGIVGLALIACAVPVTLSARRFVKSAERALGLVVHLNAGGSHPQVQFTTRSGETISYAANGLIFGYRPGDRPSVVYDALSPRESAKLDTVLSIWGVPLLLSLVGLAFFLMALFDGAES